MNRNGKPIICAFRTLRQEILGFNFSYPLETDIAAGPRDSLNYYLYSDRLSWETIRMDSNGIPRAWVRVTGTNYWPGFIAWYALVELGHYLRGKGSQHLATFLTQVDWLERNAVIRDDGAAVWAMHFDNPENGVLLRAPWVSAHAQGLAMSAVVRGWRLTRKPRLFDLLRRSACIFNLDVSENGIRTQIDGNTFYTEVPGGALPGILDGFLTSLLGLYDLYTETDDERVGRLWREGVEGLRNLLPWWNYRNKWSWYGCRDYLSTPAYNCLNRLLLNVIGRLTGYRDFEQLAERWDPANLSALGRAEIFLRFLQTKNAARLRYRTWLQKTVVDDDEMRSDSVTHPLGTQPRV